MKETILKKEIEPNNLIKPSFEKKYLDEEMEETGAEIISLRLNAEERRRLDLLKRLLHYNQDAKVIKIGLEVLKNVILGTFGADIMDKISDKDRRRLIFENPKEP